jgi:hypothetical protein
MRNRRSFLEKGGHACVGDLALGVAGFDAAGQNTKSSGFKYDRNSGCIRSARLTTTSGLPSSTLSQGNHEAHGPESHYPPALETG